MSGSDQVYEYFLSFFAGITVQTSNVIIRTFRQSIELYYHLGCFPIIELDSQSIMPGQGSGMFGASPSIAENVEIKNGYFGSTSHYAIHGNRNKNIHIHDIDISHFETHGIQLNEFGNIISSDITIHDSSQIAFFAISVRTSCSMLFFNWFMFSALC